MIRLTRGVYQAVLAHARKELPNECCGYLAGREGLIDTHYELTNVDASPEHFSFDPREQFATVRAAREAGLSVLANYHSHPATPARPSQEDIRLAYDPGISYLILSLAGDSPDLKAFSIVRGEVNPQEIQVVEE